MSDPFIGEVRIWANNFAPRGWAYCNGQLLNIAQNTALFSVLATAFGGDGRVNFGLPNLSGRAPMGQGQGPGLRLRRLGEVSGQPSVSLDQTQMPSHSHTVQINDAVGGTDTPAGSYLAQGYKNIGREANRPQPIYNIAPNSSMDSASVSVTGGGESHQNMQPFLAINFCIALDGLYPSRS